LVLGMSEQLDMIYDWMIKHGKYLKKRKICNMCKKSSEDVEFYSNVNICNECWSEYIKLSKAEKKELRCNIKHHGENTQQD